MSFAHPLGRRTFFARTAQAGLGLSALGVTSCAAPEATTLPATKPVQLVYPNFVTPPANTPAYSGHTDTVPDIAGRVNAPAGLTIFSEGNHFMVLNGGEVLAPFRKWAESRPASARLDLSNIVVVTLPQPAIVQMISNGSATFGNMTLEVSPASGFYPDIVMAGATPLKALLEAGVVHGRPRVFARNRGLAMLVRRSTSAVTSLDEAATSGTRLVMADRHESSARSRNRATITALLGKDKADRLFSHEVTDFPGRLGITHRDVPKMLAEGVADVGLAVRNIVAYYAKTFPEIFTMVPIESAEHYSGVLGLAATGDPSNKKATKAFIDYFFTIAKELYPRYDFAEISAAEYGSEIKT